MRRDLIIIALTAVVVGILVRECASKTEIRVVPSIVTVYDTVTTTPSWLTDSLKRWKKVVHTTDTLRLYVTNTVVDTEFIPVNAPPEQRPKLWPVLNLRTGRQFGDTGIVNTYSVQTGALATSRIFIPGYVTAVDADTGSMPKITFEPFPETKRQGASLWEKIKYTALGASSASLICMLRP